jgi:hypothetical protein
MSIILVAGLLQYLALKSLILDSLQSQIETTKISILSFGLIQGFDTYNAFQYSFESLS